MSYIDEIFKRTDIQHIREFLLRGVECVEINPQSYKQRLEEAWDVTNNTIKKKLSEVDDYEKFLDEVYDYIVEVEDVYMEIGLRCGAILTAQLLGGAR